MKKVNISHLNMNNNVNIYIDIYVFEIYIFHTNMHVNKHQQLLNDPRRSEERR